MKENQQLMERGKAALDCVGSNPVELCRGMEVVTADGEQVGHIAAVLTSDDQRTVGTHIVLLLDPMAERNLTDGDAIHEQAAPHYRLLPVQAIAAIDARRVQLTTSTQRLRLLPSWHQCPV